MIRIALYGESKSIRKYRDIVANSADFILSGIYVVNSNDENSSEENIRFGNTVFNSSDDIIFSSDAIVFLDYIPGTFYLVKKALTHSRHIFIHSNSVIPAKDLQFIHKYGDEAGVLYYLRHDILGSELRKGLQAIEEKPEFIDNYRYVPTNIQWNDESIQRIITRELLFIYSLNNSELKKYNLKTVPYCSEAPYIINIRLEFANSSTSNLTINFFTHDNVRFAELFYRKNMLRIDSQKGVIECINRSDGNYIVTHDDFNIRDEKKLDQEINRFLNLLKSKTYPLDFRSSGLEAHRVICAISEQISTARVNMVQFK